MLLVALACIFLTTTAAEDEMMMKEKERMMEKEKMMDGDKMCSEETGEVDLAILGCGPAGVQAALYARKFNISYVVYEKAGQCADFFSKYPKGGELISFNKPNIPSALPNWKVRSYYCKHATVCPLFVVDPASFHGTLYVSD